MKKVWRSVHWIKPCKEGDQKKKKTQPQNETAKTKTEPKPQKYTNTPEKYYNDEQLIDCTPAEDIWNSISG